MKRILFAVALGVAFLVGYGGAVKAWPGVPDRSAHYGYFLNQFDDWGDSVIQGGYPSYVNNASSFISFVENQLWNGSAQNRTGAAFTIQIMRGNSAGWSRNRPPTSWEIADWESRVRYAESQGWISWFANFTYSGNSYWQGGSGGSSSSQSNPNDDAFYYENGTRQSMIFRNAGGGAASVIKRDCGNPLTYGYMPGLDMGWSGAGRTDVSSSTAQPGQSVTFYHYVWDQGPTAALMYWGTFDSNTGNQLAQGGPNTFNVGVVTNVNNETFPIPNNAAAGTQYCRQVGWFWNTSGDGSWGKAAPTCVTVVIPAKLKAAISASPPTISPGDSVTFTPNISETSNNSGISGVTCTLSRTTYAPGGGATGTTSIPCTDKNGNSSITVGSGASVNLATNTYASPDNTPVGAQVCETITITNPNQPGYYNNYPADTTSTTCVKIAKSPYVYFLGGDVWAGGGFASVGTGACNAGSKITTIARSHPLTGDGTTPGSGVAYAAFALGKISGFGSASMALVPSSGTGDAWTFSNINSGNLGFFGAPQHCITDYSSLYTSATNLAGGSTVNTNTQGSGVWHSTGSITISGNVPAGSTQVYLVDGDVTISNNITYPTTFTNGGDIPSLVIVSKHNVYVSSNVNQIDGIIEAIGDGATSGIFYTCWPKVAQATNATCPSTLTINGAVLSGSLDLFRTAGAEGPNPPAQKQAAEVFNLSPEVYMNDALNPSTQTTITTTNVRELAPRF